MALDPKENYKDIKNNVQKERRVFLKKTAYAVPSIVALGQLVRPTVAGASEFDDKEGPGGGFGGNGFGPGGQ